MLRLRKLKEISKKTFEMKLRYYWRLLDYNIINNGINLFCYCFFMQDNQVLKLLNTFTSVLFLIKRLFINKCVIPWKWALRVCNSSSTYTLFVNSHWKMFFKIGSWKEDNIVCTNDLSCFSFCIWNLGTATYKKPNVLVFLLLLFWASAELDCCNYCIIKHYSHVKFFQK